MRPSSGAMTRPSRQREVGHRRVVARRARRGTPAGRPTAGRAAARITPAAATTAHQRRVRNEPSRMRNSPTKPLSPGRPIDDSITTVNTAARIGAAFCRPVQLGDLAGVAALVDHADEEEQGAGRDAVVDHLEHAALEALGGEGEGAEDDEAEVGHRRVGDEPLQVLLHGGDDGAVDDADHAEGQEQPGRSSRPPRGTGRGRSAGTRRCRASA